MNYYEAEILKNIKQKKFINQRFISKSLGYSLGVVNKSLKSLIEKGYLTEKMELTLLAEQLFIKHAPKNAVILAAGFGMRMIPINMTTPKALLEVKGERLIDRLIAQLNEAGINKIYVVVGFMKDSFEYLIDKYGVELVYNSQYASLNNLHSLSLIAEKIHNTYIVPCDVWFKHNPFSANELYSWYMFSSSLEKGSVIRINRKGEAVKISDNDMGNKMVGLSYLTEPEATGISEKLADMDNAEHSDDSWENALYNKGKMKVTAKTINDSDYVEINTYEQLRELDSDSNHLKSDVITAIANSLNCDKNDIVDINILKKGMTNRSFIFSVNEKKYIMRIPGEGTDKLINRKQEADVFNAIHGRGLCDDPIYINSDNGYKITEYLEGARVCDSRNEADVKRCIKKLREFHSMNITVSHDFDLFNQIEFYEKLWEGEKSVFFDYKTTKEDVFNLKTFVDGLDKGYCLTHIDAVPDNFLFYKMPNGKEGLQLTDWEYAGMQDPHVDIAMFCIYSLYDKKQCDRLIDIYFDNDCNRTTRAKIYAYISICGLLWSNWCEYKRKLGIEFGEYSLYQYRYAKEYYRYANNELNILENEEHDK